MKIIYITMEQSEEESDMFKHVPLLSKRTDNSWFEIQQNVVLDQQYQQTLAPSFYYKHQANTETGSKWWKDDAEISATKGPHHLPENTSAITYPLMNQALDSQSVKLQHDIDSNIKELIKPRQQKKSKIIKEHRDPTKRVKHPDQWKVNIKKNARLRGEEYIGVGGKLVPAKVMGPPCKCRMRCSEKVNEATREELHSIFWKTCNWEQRKQYIALSVKESPKQRTRCRGNVKSQHRRQITFTYSLMIKDEFITVCKCMFLSTFAVSEKFVRHAMDKKRTSPSGTIGPDLRGKHTPKTKKSESVRDRVREHIKLFPSMKSDNLEDDPNKRYLDSSLSIAAMHKLYVIKCKEDCVPDSDVVKESYYREMFKTEFNLGFKRAKLKETKEVRSANGTGKGNCA